MKPAQRELTFALAALTLILLVASNALAGQDGEAGKGKHGPGRGHASSDGSAFTTILHHYEGIRQELLADQTEDLTAHAQAIRDTTQALEKDFSAAKAGVQPDMAEEARNLLPTLSKAAAELAMADDLEAAREALYALSKTLVRYRKLATGDLPTVAYCPMLKRSWLQPEGKIGNPYYGQEMPTCGEIVDG